MESTQIKGVTSTIRDTSATIAAGATLIVREKIMTHGEQFLPTTMENIRLELNKIVAPYEKIEKITLMPTEFEKTPKRSIKRFLYSQ